MNRRDLSVRVARTQGLHAGASRHRRTLETRASPSGRMHARTHRTLAGKPSAYRTALLHDDRRLKLVQGPQMRPLFAVVKRSSATSETKAKGLGEGGGCRTVRWRRPETAAIRWP